MTQDRIVSAFDRLSQILVSYAPDIDISLTADQLEMRDALDTQIRIAGEKNPWFTKENVHYALYQWGKDLTRSALTQWLDKYATGDLPGVSTSLIDENLVPHSNSDVQDTGNYASAKANTEANKHGAPDRAFRGSDNIIPTWTDSPSRIGVILAGNIPMVGWHDLLSILITGNHAVIKYSSDDEHLTPFLLQLLQFMEPEVKDCISVVQQKLEGYDAVIATGSNNSARYFEYYFKDVPHVIRHNRNSVAVLDEDATVAQVEPLGEDIFRYFGLGCRSVSKIYVHESLDIDVFFKAIFPWQELINNSRYANNYDYNKAVYLMSEYDLLDNGFLLLNPSTSNASPIATLNYERYSNVDALTHHLRQDAENLQCVVATAGVINELQASLADLPAPQVVSPGQSQAPRLWDYADGVDTISWLSQLKTFAEA